MGRPKDEYYRKFWREENGQLTCKHCGLDRPEKTSVSRLKAHILGIKRQGITICPTPPKDITSSNHSDQDINVITASQVVENGLGMDGGASTSSAALFEGNEEEYGNGVLTTLQTKLDELRSDLTCEEEDIEGQLQLLESHGKKPKRKVDRWLNEIQNMKQRAIEIKNSLNKFGCPNFEVPQGEMYSAEESQKNIEDLTEEIQKHKKLKPLVLCNEYFGWKFEKNVETLWKLMRDDRVFIIGIYGMGGVGKTFLATYMQSEIERTKTFKDVLWVTVSHDFTIFKLQQLIAEIIKVRLCKEDERERAIILAKELEKKENIILILDDVWKYIDLEKVRIPLRVNGIKLIMTSRSRNVFQQMDCLSINTVEVNPFHDYHYYCNTSDYDYNYDYDDDNNDNDDYDENYDYREEAWKLFLLKLRSSRTHLTLFPEVRCIARSIVKKCNGLPLGISVMAQTMKGKTDIHWWRHELNKFDRLEMGVEMQEKVFTVLKRSYDNLSEKHLQKCFLYIALLPNFMFRSCLIGKLVNTGLLDENKSVEEIFDKANVTVDELVNHSLLEAVKINHPSSVENDLVLSMHALVRKMALNILKGTVSNMMLKCNGNMPDTQKWAIDLEVVSLAKNEIKTIPEGTSPNCPHLLTLLLFENYIKHIPECFFTHMNALTMLDLSKNKFLKRLPRSLSNLGSLTSLMLHECSKLNYIPPLGKLQSLLRLQISRCSIKAPPKGLEKLINLKWLDMSMNENLKLVPGSFLSSLTKIQYLDLSGCTGGIGVEDVKRMTMLECFAGKFVDHDNLDGYVTQILDNTNGPQTYFIYLDNGPKMSLWSESYLFTFKGLSTFKGRTMFFRNCKEWSHLLSGDILELLLDCNDHWTCLCDAMFLNDDPLLGPILLKEIHIRYWKKLTSIFCSSCILCYFMSDLHTLRFDYLESLTVICKEFPEGDMFYSLKTLSVNECHRMKLLLPLRLVQQLENLQYITVTDCNSMEEIFGVTYEDDKDDEDEHDDSNKIKLCKLISLTLVSLQELKTVCEGILICKSGFQPFIRDCPKLCRPIIEYVA